MEIKINQLVARYQNKIALDISQMAITKPGAYGIIGSNGAGKTTFFKCLANIITNYSGEITINDQSVAQKPAVLKNAGFVLDGVSLYRNQSGWFNIKYFSRLRGTFDQHKANELANNIGLTKVLDQKVKTYSYGMQKKLILMIALLNNPELLVLDEPFRGLDVQTVTWFKTYLKDLVANAHLTLLISSHIKGEIEELCDQAYVLNEGQFIEVIDLQAGVNQQLRLLDTSNNRRLETVLDELNYKYDVLTDGRLVLSLKDQDLQILQKQLLQNKIDIKEMSFFNALDHQLN
ncbi:ATP-binding cassette domain-containing protein [Lactobacillus curvatus]|nr:ATP-binding cassette domain-containing protein [Latilactobacillus curvatus]MSE24447.1 ATP-binding cassette domain-containing protein [Latilactobacillus curvatus]